MSDTYHIGEVASRVGLSLRTVRAYDETGLVRPSGRTEGGFRLYSEADGRRLLLIRALTPVDLSAEEMVEVLDLRDRLRRGQPSDGDTARLSALIVVAEQRLKIRRERLIAAELAVEALRAAVPEALPSAVPEEPAPAAGSAR